MNKQSAQRLKLSLPADLQSAPALLATLCVAYPLFTDEWALDNPFIAEDGSFSLHAVWMAFLPFWTRCVHESTAVQVGCVAALINASVAAGGRADNAVSTCVLEHAHQVKAVRDLKPALSVEARSRMRA